MGRGELGSQSSAMISRRILLPALVPVLSCVLCGQDLSKVAAKAAGAGEKGPDSASVLTRPDARTMTLSIPAPRGMITDRHGKPLAQNRVGYQFAIQFAHFQDPVDTTIISWARERVAHASGLAGRDYKVEDDVFLSHYKHRRWLPLIFAASLVSPDKEESFKKQLIPGLVMHPIYHRYYPGGSSAAHVIGYVRSKGRLPVGPIGHGDLLFEDSYGDAGLEKTMDQELVSLGLSKPHKHILQKEELQQL